jgi:urease alpha subunit
LDGVEPGILLGLRSGQAVEPGKKADLVVGQRVDEGDRPGDVVAREAADALHIGDEAAQEPCPLPGSGVRRLVDGKGRAGQAGQYQHRRQGFRGKSCRLPP